MKTTTAVIRLVLRTNKTLSDGTHPIMLRCSWHGMKERATGFSCIPSQWDEKNERLKKTYPNYATVNQIIGKLKNDALERRDYLEASGSPYSSSDVLSSTDKEKTPQKGLKWLAEAYVNEKHLSKGTGRTYKSLVHRLERFFGHSLLITEVTEEKVRAFAGWLEKDGLKDGGIVNYLNSFQAVCGFAVEKGLIRSNPFGKYKYKKRFKPVPLGVFIHYSALEVMKDTLMTMLSLEPDLPNQKMNPNHALYMYMLMVLFQGLAPVDLFLIKNEDFYRKRINNKTYYYYETKRRKTGVPVKIIIPEDDYSKMMIEPLIKRGGKYLLPFIKSDAEVHRELNRALHFINRYLPMHWNNLNKTIGIMRGSGKMVEKIDERCTLYSARHSFAHWYMSKGGSPIALATLLGRSVNTISTYLKELSSDIDLEEMAGILNK